MKLISKEEWAEALVSGKYQQGRGVLADKEKTVFCCLGVACDLADAFYPGMNMMTSTLPAKLQEHLGLGQTVLSPFGMNDTMNYSQGAVLASFNDAGATFEEIAHIILHGLDIPFIGKVY